ncbi:GDSL-type esterase/lipase family protein [Terasakiella sp. A23]|uniref:GDSL-type esterase/lipase family protein n=1 Tax=Terasakiella sp. FCG-A23 TaxID=3080561 RepID=UPI002953FE7E|nr:GDSL-type esterase/lipase family protein [Terasakiella sp. A23]MDV7340838.1 GDSL-type esterase/lipase family protein [Terasakiella sp. A23]
MSNQLKLLLWIVTGLFVAGLLFFGGLRVIGAHNRDWAIGAGVLYALPIILILIPRTGTRTTGAWIGVFLLIEFILSITIHDTDYHTMVPNLDEKLEVVGDVMPGFAGIQQITTDHKGFRVTRDVDYDNKPDNAYRIFAVGASTTAQDYLGDEKTWTHQLQQHLQADMADKQVEVINTGLSGLRAEQNVSTLKNILAYDPDMVVFLLGINDWNRQIRHELSDGLARKHFFEQYQPEKSLIGTAVQAIRAKVRAARKAGKPVPKKEIQKADGNYYAKHNRSFERRTLKPFDVTAVSENYDDAVTDLMELCQAFEVKCVFLTQPTGYQEGAEKEIVDRFWMTPPEEAYTVGMTGVQKISQLYNNYLIEKSKEFGHQSCDIAKDVPPTTEYMYDDCHYNENGARHVAELVYRCIAK